VSGVGKSMIDKKQADIHHSALSVSASVCLSGVCIGTEIVCASKRWRYLQLSIAMGDALEEASL